MIGWFVPLSGVLQGHKIPGTLPCLLLPSADRWSCEDIGISLPGANISQPSRLSKGMGKKWGISLGIAIAKKYLVFPSEIRPTGICVFVTILRYTQLIYKSELKFSWLSMSLKLWGWLMRVFGVLLMAAVTWRCLCCIRLKFVSPGADI